MKSVLVHIIGHVQGVGFRATIARHADEYCIAGYAQNLSDGSVEVVAQGEDPMVEKFLDQLQRSPGFATIESFDALPYSQDFLFEEFTIR